MCDTRVQPLRDDFEKPRKLVSIVIPNILAHARTEACCRDSRWEWYLPLGLFSQSSLDFLNRHWASEFLRCYARMLNLCMLNLCHVNKVVYFGWNLALFGHILGE